MPKAKCGEVREVQAGNEGGAEKYAAVLRDTQCGSVATVDWTVGSGRSGAVMGQCGRV